MRNLLQMTDILGRTRWIGFLCSALLPMIAAAQTAPLKCADLSSLDELEASGAVFRDQGVPGDALAILHAHGLESIRLRLFHSPNELRDGLDDVLALARRAHDLGYSIVLNLHYSDTWADPEKQTKPAAWSSLPFDALRDSVYEYTASALTALTDQGTPPLVVQVGNEITTGMLWDAGRVGGSFDVPAQWAAFSTLLSAGIAAVRDNSQARVMIHIDRGGDPAGARWFFDRLAPFDLDYDIIGLSYYPWFHGPMNGLRNTVRLIRERYQKPIILIETAYPWTLLWNDNQHNRVGLPEHTVTGYPATPEGQADFISAMWSIIPEGVCYWAGELISAPRRGSSWENIALFDFDSNVLPAARALGSGSTSTYIIEPSEQASMELFPNPIRAGFARLTLSISSIDCGEARIFDALGRLRLTVESNCHVDHQVFDLNLAPGVYWMSIPGLRAKPFVVIP